jgi:creatinine amidohydrolase/Fe(II)-dependent formamide hydrolase-like protein
MEKVRYHEMLPHEIVARRERFPAAFVGLGGLEWHGEHLAVGNDALKAESLCELAAARSGGFALPTLWYGEPRVHRLMEFSHDHDGAVKSKMEFKTEKFRASYFGKTAEQQIAFYQELLYHLMIQMNTLEIRAVCLLGGHGPLPEYAQPAVQRFNDSFKDTQVFVGTEVDFAPEGPAAGYAHRTERWCPAPPRPDVPEGDPGQREVWYRECVGTDHAAKWETSYLWYLRPNCVDTSIYLGRDEEELIGLMGIDPRREASIEVGRRGCDLIVDGMIRKAEELMRATGWVAS